MIKGISDVRRCPRLGYIRLGLKGKTGSGKEYPKEVDYFILEPHTGSKADDKRLLEEFHALYGEKPKSINVMFPPTDRDRFFPQYYKRYGTNAGLKCKGDGERAACVSREDAEGLEIIGKSDFGQLVVKCLGPECPYQKGPKTSCRRLACLQVLLPELSMGVFQLNTSSYHSIVNVNSALDWIQGLCGRYSMIPIALRRVPQKIQHRGAMRTHYILKIDLNKSLSELQKLGLIAPEKATLSFPEVDDRKDTVLYTEANNGEGGKGAKKAGAVSGDDVNKADKAGSHSQTEPNNGDLKLNDVPDVKEDKQKIKNTPEPTVEKEQKEKPDQGEKKDSEKEEVVISEDVLDQKLTFGIHNGKTWKEVAEIDLGYIDYIAKGKTDNSETARKVLVFLSKKANGQTEDKKIEVEEKDVKYESLLTRAKGFEKILGKNVVDEAREALHYGEIDTLTMDELMNLNGVLDKCSHQEKQVAA